MSQEVTDQGVSALYVHKQVRIAASPEVVFETILEQVGPKNEMPDGTPLPMVIEAWPGGRWFRDLGGKNGHFWGHVQVIKRPALLEICGPLFMSYPAISHVQYRLTAKGDGTLLTFVHRAIGQITTEHREGVDQGWDSLISRIRKAAEN